MLYSAAVLADNTQDTNDWLVRIQLAVMASQGRVQFADILDFVFGKQPTPDPTPPEVAADATEEDASGSDSESDTDDEVEHNYGPGKIKATAKMWKFLNQMRDSPLMTYEEIANSNVYDFTFQTEVRFIKNCFCFKNH